MKGVVQFCKTTLIGGVMFLLPVVLIFLILREAVRYLAKLVRPIAKLIPAGSVGGVAMDDVVAILLLITIAFVAGLIARTEIGTKLNANLERMVLRKMPGFTLLKSITGSAKGDTTDTNATVALANIDDAWLFAFIIETHANGMLTVFVPSAPTPTAGSIYFLTEQQVKRLDIPVRSAVKCIMQLGVGSRDLLKSGLPSGSSARTS